MLQSRNLLREEQRHFILFYATKYSRIPGAFYSRIPGVFSLQDSWSIFTPGFVEYFYSRIRGVFLLQNSRSIFTPGFPEYFVSLVQGFLSPHRHFDRGEESGDEVGHLIDGLFN